MPKTFAFEKHKTSLISVRKRINVLIHSAFEFATNNGRKCALTTFKKPAKFSIGILKIPLLHIIMACAFCLLSLGLAPTTKCKIWHWQERLEERLPHMLFMLLLCDIH